MPDGRSKVQRACPESVEGLKVQWNTATVTGGGSNSGKEARGMRRPIFVEESDEIVVVTVYTYDS